MMSEIRRKFAVLSGKYPSLSTLAVWGKMVREGHVAGKYLHKSFNELVDRDDYARHDKEDIIKFYATQ